MQKVSRRHAIIVILGKKIADGGATTKTTTGRKPELIESDGFSTGTIKHHTCKLVGGGAADSFVFSGLCCEDGENGGAPTLSVKYRCAR